MYSLCAASSKWVAAPIISLLLPACSLLLGEYSRDVTNKPAYWGGVVPESTYRVAQDMFLINSDEPDHKSRTVVPPGMSSFSYLPGSVAEYEGDPMRSAPKGALLGITGIIRQGTTLRISRLDWYMSATGGTTGVMTFATVVDGPLASEELDIGWLGLDHPTEEVAMTPDPRFLVPVESATSDQADSGL